MWPRPSRGMGDLLAITAVVQARGLQYLDTQPEDGMGTLLTDVTDGMDITDEAVLIFC